MFGLVGIVVLMGVMKRVLDAPPEPIVAVTVVVFLLMLFLEAVFLRLLFRGRRSAEPDVNPPSIKGHATKELDSTQPRSLGEPVSSVTEHTTRAFDPVYIDKTKQ